MLLYNFVCDTLDSSIPTSTSIFSKINKKTKRFRILIKRLIDVMSTDGLMKYLLLHTNFLIFIMIVIALIKMLKPTRQIRGGS
jgi:hypothetical protein